MAATFTEYKLTDAQLTRLSQIVHQRPNLAGVALDALVRKNLVYRKEDYLTDHYRYGKHCFYMANGNGEQALRDARAAGW